MIRLYDDEHEHEFKNIDEVNEYLRDLHNGNAQNLSKLPKTMQPMYWCGVKVNDSQYQCFHGVKNSTKWHFEILEIDN